MLCVQINDIKKMTELLFTDDTFDKFETFQVHVKTEYETEISGKRILKKDQENTESLSPYVPWKNVRPVVLRIIQGKALPESFKIVLITDKKSTDFIIEKSGFSGSGISSFSINFNFQAGVLTVTGGVSYESFTLDKSAETYWENTLRKFLTDKAVDFTEN